MQLSTLQSAESDNAFDDGFGGMEQGLLQISSKYNFKEKAKNMTDQRNVSAVDVCIEGSSWLSCLLLTSLLARMYH